jgi:RNA 2',3'-cyclic 3'-phosphodiesterase
MAEQGSLFDADSSRVDPSTGTTKHNLFLALLPDLDVATQAGACANRFASAFGLKDRIQEPERMHVTLHSIGLWVGVVVLPEVIDAVKAMVSSLRCGPIAVCFDSVESFPGSGAFALRCDAASQDRIKHLRALLGRGLRQVGLKPQENSTPHMTLLYDRVHCVERQAIEPICWTATDLVLVDSWVHEHRHVHLAHRTLGSIS